MNREGACVCDWFVKDTTKRGWRLREGAPFCCSGSLSLSPPPPSPLLLLFPRKIEPLNRLARAQKRAQKGLDSRTLLISMSRGLLRR